MSKLDAIVETFQRYCRDTQGVLAPCATHGTYCNAVDYCASRAREWILSALRERDIEAEDTRY